MTTKIYYKPITEGNGKNHNDVKILFEWRYSKDKITQEIRNILR